MNLTTSIFLYSLFFILSRSRYKLTDGISEEALYIYTRSSRQSIPGNDLFNSPSKTFRSTDRHETMSPQIVLTLEFTF